MHRLTRSSSPARHITHSPGHWLTCASAPQRGGCGVRSQVRLSRRFQSESRFTCHSGSARLLHGISPTFTTRKVATLRAVCCDNERGAPRLSAGNPAATAVVLILSVGQLCLRARRRTLRTDRHVRRALREAQAIHARQRTILSASPQPKLEPEPEGRVGSIGGLRARP